MLPSSRTPEGEPFRCSICGASTSVEVSRPPGDSVCPSCGTLAWIPQQGPSDHEKRNGIRSFVRELMSIERTDLQLRQVGQVLVSGLTRCLAAYGAILWVESPRKWWARKSGLSAIADFGDTHSSDFAREVFQSKRELVRIVNIAGRKTMLLGVPVICGNKVLGVIEVLQRADGAADAQQGYLCFVKHMADLVGRSQTVPVVG